MKSIKVTIFGRQYPLKVEDEDEENMQQIAAYVDSRLRTFKNELTNQSETTVMILTCLSLAEELYLERKKNTGQNMSDDIFDYVNNKMSKLLSEIKA